MLRRIESIVKKVSGQPPLYLHEPRFLKDDELYVQDCLRTGWVSYAGEYVKKFEEHLSSFTGLNYAAATVNGTVALQVALQIVGVTAGDEVLVPSITFVASANAVVHAGGTSHFIEVSERDFGIDALKLDEYLQRISYSDDQGHCINKKTKKIIRAIVPVHILGHPCSIEDISNVARRYNLKIVEDAAESLGSFVSHDHVGHFGDIAVLSFNGNKLLTTGGGGALLTNNKDYFEKALRLTTTAKKPHAYEFFHDEVAYNYRLPNLNAALGCSQMERIHTLLEKKRVLAQRYEDAFSKESDIAFHNEPPGTKSNYWLNSIRIKGMAMSERNHLLQGLIDKGFHCRPLWTPMHLLPMFNACPRMEDFFVTDTLHRDVICLPSSVFLADHA